MKSLESSEKNGPKKELSGEDLISILSKPSKNFLKKSGFYDIISIESFKIVAGNLLGNNLLSVRLPVSFVSCHFEYSGDFIIDGIVFEEALTFEGCEFSEDLYFLSGIFRKELFIKYSKLRTIQFGECTFGKISVSCYDIHEIKISETIFDSLILGEHLENSITRKLTVFAKEGKGGNISVKKHVFEELYLSGINKAVKYVFSNIKCNTVSICDFTNEGVLSFYGVEPKYEDGPSSYFQIINSILNNAEFHRVNFSKFKELIIKNSIVTDVNFIGCVWRDNVRAQYGPGYADFERSVSEGRTMDHSEVVAIKEAYRQLKISHAKNSDRIQEMKFYGEELNFHNKTLKWGKPWKNDFWDKLILHWSRLFSDYGQSFYKPLFWLLSIHLLLFLIALSFGGFSPLYFPSNSPTKEDFELAFEKYFIYINPLRKLEPTFTGYLIIVDLVMRVWSSYMIYNLIRASRRFIS